ncbi:MAG: endonuclease III [Candidatus Thorarchaeota archaeon]|nr:endonuclease III [Candidatus Thorarchaeota archaeon]
MRDKIDAKQLASKVCERLEAHYGTAISSRRLPPIDELVLTILSQNTTDVNADRAFHSLKQRFATWEQMLDAGERAIAEAIRSSGSFNVKAHRIVAALDEIRQRVGSLDLSLLEEMPLDEAKAWLTSLHGVGPKTAAIVLLFSFHRPALPVDTHVYRISTRLGLIPPKTSLLKAHALLEELLPPSCIFSFNHNLVRHGRSVCKAVRPHCGFCFLCDLCNSCAR